MKYDELNNLLSKRPLQSQSFVVNGNASRELLQARRNEAASTYKILRKIINSSQGSKNNVSDVEQSVIQELKYFLAERWNSIKNKNQAYTQDTENPGNKLCVALAQLIARHSKLKSDNQFQLLMPTILYDQATISYLSLSDSELKTSNFIVSDNNTSLIHIGETLDYSVENGVLRQTFVTESIMDGSNGKQLTNSEQNRLINHSHYTRTYHETVQDMIVQQDDTQRLGAALIRLSQGLKQGSYAYFSSGTEYRAGAEANIAISEFFAAVYPKKKNDTSIKNVKTEFETSLSAPSFLATEIHYDKNRYTLGDYLFFLRDPSNIRYKNEKDQPVKVCIGRIASDIPKIVENNYQYLFSRLINGEKVPNINSGDLAIKLINTQKQFKNHYDKSTPTIFSPTYRNNITLDAIIARELSFEMRVLNSKLSSLNNRNLRNVKQHGQGLYTSINDFIRQGIVSHNLAQHVNRLTSNVNELLELASVPSTPATRNSINDLAQTIQHDAQRIQTSAKYVDDKTLSTVLKIIAAVSLLLIGAALIAAGVGAFVSPAILAQSIGMFSVPAATAKFGAALSIGIGTIGVGSGIGLAVDANDKPTKRVDKASARQTRQIVDDTENFARAVAAR